MHKKSELLEQTKGKIEKLNRQYDQISNLRLLIGVIGLILFILSVVDRILLYLIGFIIAVIKYDVVYF